MRRISAIGTAAATLLFVAGLSAQAPNFAGKWTRVDDPAAAGAGGGGGRGGGRGGGGGGAIFNCGMGCDIKQDAKTITITRQVPARGGGEATTQTQTINLGSETKIQMAARGGGEPTTVTANAKWDGAKLVISSTMDMQGTPVTRTQTISMEGGNMVVESSSGREGATPTKVTYKKG